MPQRSNRANLIDGTLRLIERLPPDRLTARAIAAESGANLASIRYHFGSKDALVTEAAIAGLDHWLEEVEDRLSELAAKTPAERYEQSWRVIDATRKQHAGLARAYLAALAMGRHDERLRRRLAEGFSSARANVAAVLELGEDRAGTDAGGLVLSLFHGLLIQTLLDPDLAIEGGRMAAAQSRLRSLLPG